MQSTAGGIQHERVLLWLIKVTNKTQKSKQSHNLKNKDMPGDTEEEEQHNSAINKNFSNPRYVHNIFNMPWY